MRRHLNYFRVIGRGPKFNSFAIRQFHERGLIHKDIESTHVFVDSNTGQVWLTGFGIASRLPAEPPEFIASTLAHMAPEQTGRVNRSIDFRTYLC